MAHPSGTPVNTGPGIVYTCATNVAASTCNYLNTTVAGYYNDTFTNANANIYVQYGSTGLGASEYYFNYVTYSQYATAYASIAKKSAIQVSAQSALSTYDAAPYGSDHVWVQPGIVRALGLSGVVQGGCVGCNLPLLGITPSASYCTLGPAGCYDGIVTVTNSSGITLYYDDQGGTEPANAYDFYAVVEHETDEVLGTPSCISTSPLKNSCDGGSGGHGTPSAVDLFRYSGAGSLVLDSSLSTTPGAYFSYNGGLANGGVGVGGNAKYYNTLANGADYADYALSSPCGPNEAIQDAYACPGVDGGLSVLNDGGSEVNILTAIGYQVPGGGGLQFVSMAPCRIVDTRYGTGPFAGPQLTPGSTRTFNIPQGACAIPSTAVAYSLNVTVVPPQPLNYLTIWPTGQPLPNVSTLNSDGRVKANAAITPAGINGSINVYAANYTQLILDIDGYFVPAGTSNSGLQFFPLTPCRVADTRNAAGSLGGPSLSGGATRSFPVQSSSCGIPSTAQAYSLNVTAVPRSQQLSWLTAWPSGQMQPVSSTLNSPTGTVTANAAIVSAGNNGNVSVFVTDPADVILDVNGYFAPPATGGLSLYTAIPCRILDTRFGAGELNGTLAVPVESSSCTPPAAAQAYVLNATIVPPGPILYLTLWPNGEAQPVASTLNAYDGAITSNMAIVPTTNGSIDAYADYPTQLILDISGYFAP
jgi:hypothetical protein